MFPWYQPAAIEALNRQAVTLLKLFAERGYAREEPSVLQPAALFLDRSGEDIRRRTFTLTDPSGRDLALRPDLTIPSAKKLVEEGRALHARIAYNGAVFRHEPQAPEKPVQFFQAGVELFGDFLVQSLSDRISAKAHSGAPGLERWVALLGRIEQGFGRATGLHLEPRQTVLTTARDLAHVARGGAL